MGILPFNKFRLNENLFSDLKFKKYLGAGQYGDGHPIGTYFSENVSVVQAKEISSHFKMKGYNAPDNYTIDNIESDPNNQDMSVGTFTDTEDRFIYLQKEYNGLYNLYVGPKSVGIIRSFLEFGINKNDIDFSDVEDIFQDLIDENYNFDIYHLKVSRNEYRVIIQSKIINGWKDRWGRTTKSEIDKWERDIRIQQIFIDCIRNLASQKELDIDHLDISDGCLAISLLRK
jgi:hypothetical protein